MSPSIVAEIDALRQFAQDQMPLHPQLTLEECVQQFRRQQQLAKFNERMDESLAQAARGEARPLDAEALKRRVRERLAADGILD